MNWKNIAAAGITSGLMFLTCVEEYRLENSTGNSVTGHVIRERLWRDSGFGLMYRIEVKTSERREPYRAYVVIGDEKDLRVLDEKINEGDKITVTDNYSACSLDLENVSHQMISITPNDIAKMN